MNPPADSQVFVWLRQALAQSPVESSRVKKMASDAGFSPKALRRARERLEVVVARTGRRATTRSFWSLPRRRTGEAGASGARSPDPSHMCTGAEGPTQRAATISTGSLTAEVVPLVANASGARVEPYAVPDLSAAERDRVAWRTSRFVGLGMSTPDARALATRLVLERDRTSDKGGSCAECQCYDGKSCEPGAAGYTRGPRNPSEIWMCLTARRP